jgi:uncharacterized protein YjfI (DUF2170 family)
VSPGTVCQEEGAVVQRKNRSMTRGREISLEPRPLMPVSHVYTTSFHCERYYISLRDLSVCNSLAYIVSDRCVHMLCSWQVK